MEKFLNRAEWSNESTLNMIMGDKVIIETDPGTDLWQRSFYGFQKNNAPKLLTVSSDNFTFSCRVDFEYKNRFDQCGLIIYLDSKNWFKASIEYEDKNYSRLGSVVTNKGYSDWATTDISTASSWYYRLSRRGPDFLIESSADGKEYRQMRVFHLHMLGETTVQMGKANPPLPAGSEVSFGIYACSPLDSSFKAEFSEINLSDCIWLAHE